MIVGAITDVGLIRENNQDSMFVSKNKDFPLFIIADGMGGHNSGEVASSMAVDLVKENLIFHKEKLVNDKNIKNLLESAILDANKKIYNKSKENEIYNKMGTTVILAYINKSKIYLAHVGDSRAYIVGEGIEQITEDHSLVNELVKNGSITKEEALHHPQKNMITRAVGTSDSLDIDIYVLPYKKEDILVLCSDGLSNMVVEEELLNTFKGEDDMCIAVDKLVLKAKENGGKDNISVIAVKFI